MVEGGGLLQATPSALWVAYALKIIKSMILSNLVVRTHPLKRETAPDEICNNKFHT